MKLDQLKGLMWAWVYYDRKGEKHKCAGRHDAKAKAQWQWGSDWLNHVAYEYFPC